MLDCVMQIRSFSRYCILSIHWMFTPLKYHFIYVFDGTKVHVPNIVNREWLRSTFLELFPCVLFPKGSPQTLYGLIYLVHASFAMEFTFRVFSIVCCGDAVTHPEIDTRQYYRPLGVEDGKTKYIRGA
jgi:hypothetical protein